MRTEIQQADAEHEQAHIHVFYLYICDLHNMHEEEKFRRGSFL